MDVNNQGLLPSPPDVPVTHFHVIAIAIMVTAFCGIGILVSVYVLGKFELLDDIKQIKYICKYTYKNIFLKFAVQRKRLKGQRRNLKENYRDSSSHISFPNPNYSCATGGTPGEPMERRSNRFQGIFKYDKSQVVVNIFFYQELFWPFI